MAIQKIVLFNAQKFEAKCYNFDIVAYIIAIIEADLIGLQEPLK